MGARILEVPAVRLLLASLVVSVATVVAMETVVTIAIAKILAEGIESAAAAVAGTYQRHPSNH